MIRSYSDESQRTGNPVMSIAGYIMTENQSRVLDLHWKACLGDLHYFHMKEGHHVKYPKVYAALLDCIKPEYIIAGFHVAVDQDKYNLATNKKLQGQTLRYWFGSAYTFCLLAYMRLVGEWLAANIPEEESVAYFFDTGHARSGEANMFLGMLATDNKFRHQKLRYRFTSSAFVDDKAEDGRILQSSDILAWHFNYLLVNGHMRPEGKKITRAVKCFYEHYLDQQSISNSILATLEMERMLMEKRASKKKHA